MVTSEANSLTVVCAADDKYAMPLAVTIRSALVNLKSCKKIVFFVIDGGINKLNKRKILSSLNTEQVDFQVKWVQPRNALKSANF